MTGSTLLAGRLAVVRGLAVTAYVHLDLAATYDGIGDTPLPELYEPVWYAGKTLAAVTAGVAAVVAAALLIPLLIPHGRSR